MANIKGFNYGLRECPFCGSNKVTYDNFILVPYDAYIKCQDCGAFICFNGGMMQKPQLSIMDVVAAYNRRAEDE